jgi:hypothetical protein
MDQISSLSNDDVTFCFSQAGLWYLAFGLHVFFITKEIFSSCKFSHSAEEGPKYANPNTLEVHKNCFRLVISGGLNLSTNR